MIRDLIRDMKENNPHMFLVILVLIVVLLVLAFKDYSFPQKPIVHPDVDVTNQAKVNAINKALEHEVEAPKSINVADYKEKAMEFYDGAGKVFPSKVGENYELLRDVENDIEYMHTTVQVRNPNAETDAEQLKKLLIEVRDHNSYVRDKYEDDHGRYYLYVALSEHYCNSEQEFIERGTNSVDEISRLISELRDDRTYQVRIYRKYDKDGLLCYHIRIFDNYKYFEDDAERRMYAPAQLSKLDRDLFDIYMSDEKVSGKNIQNLLDEVIAYNESRSDPENGIIVNLNLEVDNDRSYHQNNMTSPKMIELQSYYVDQMEYFKVRRQSVGMQTAYGYMYTYVIYIEQVYD